MRTHRTWIAFETIISINRRENSRERKRCEREEDIAELDNLRETKTITRMQESSCLRLVEYFNTQNIQHSDKRLNLATLCALGTVKRKRVYKNRVKR